MTARCANGSTFTSDIVIGADGIHSRVRQEIYRLSELKSPGLMEPDKHRITAEYRCVFGVSAPMPSLPKGQSNLSSDINFSSLLFTTKDSLPLWGFFSKLDRKYQGSSIPRFTKSEMEQLLEQHKDHFFMEGVTLQDLLNTTRTMSYQALEEGVARFWMHERLVCIGDSVHKMTPNFGQGGNQAIESAAVLTNCLVELLGQKPTGHPSLPSLEAALQKYQDMRRERANMFVQLSAAITRHEAQATLSDTLRFHYKPPTTELSASMFQAFSYLMALMNSK